MLRFSLDVTAYIKLNRSDSVQGPLALHSKGTCFESGNRIPGLKNVIAFLRLSRQQLEYYVQLPHDNSVSWPCQHSIYSRRTIPSWSQDSVVGIGTGYGLDDRGVGVRVPVGSRIFSSSRHPDRLWDPPNLLSNG
jgi:hypothetical protein